jgi:hypothetical protein
MLTEYEVWDAMEQKTGLSSAVPANSGTASPRRCAQSRNFCICAVFRNMTMLASGLNASATTCISSECLA